MGMARIAGVPRSPPRASDRKVVGSSVAAETSTELVRGVVASKRVVESTNEDTVAVAFGTAGELATKPSTLKSPDTNKRQRESRDKFFIIFD